MSSKGRAPQHRRSHRIGGWLPRDLDVIKNHVRHVLKSALDDDLQFVSPVQDLASLVYGNPEVYMLFTQMLTEVPTRPPYDKDPSGQPEISNVPDLLTAINWQIQQPISYNDSAQIGTPINAILDWPMGTKAGFAAFLRDDVNACFRGILVYWSCFLSTSASVATVTTADGGWLSPMAQADKLSPGLKDFLTTYAVPDANEPIRYGFST